MTRTFRVIDCRPDGGNAITQVARTPEEAARLAIGERLVRSGQTSLLRAKVYFESTGACSMVRLYSPSPRMRSRSKELGQSEIKGGQNA